MNKIWGKLFIAFILITIVIVTAVGLLLNDSFQRKFAEYVKANLNEKHETLILYVETQLNNEIPLHTVMMNLAHFSVMENVRVQLLFPTGEVIFDSIDSEYMMVPFPEKRKLLPLNPRPYVTERPIPVEGTEYLVRVISELGDGVWSPGDITFREAIYSSLLASGGVALLLAIFFSIFMSSKIIRPITKLKSAALLISRGDWKTRVKIESGDELEELGESFNKMARDLEVLESLRRKMTADMAHELRNPLMSIQSYIEGMLDQVIEPDESHLTDLHEEVQRLSRLVENMQKLASVEGRRQVYPTFLQMNKEFSPYFERMNLLYRNKGVALEWKIEEVAGNLDKFVVKEILQNVLDNALKYTGDGGKVMCILDREKVDGKTGLQIQINDTGIGIGNEDLPYIFERFYRADPSRSRQTGGTGIGLAITKELIELVEGKISVESKLGKGTTFTVFIPFAK